MHWARNRISYLLLSLLFLTCTVAARVNVKWPQSRVVSVAGGSAHLPCLAAQPLPGDHALLVVWYKDGARRPFYILDVREGEDGREHVEGELQERLVSDPTGTRLLLSPAKGSDTGTYECRVDFNISPTRSSIVTLTVYVVPSRLVVLDVQGRTLHGGVLRSLTEGHSLTLYCIASGGRPPPEVSWWKGGQLLSNQSTTVDGNLLASHEDNDGDDVMMTLGVGVGVRYVRTVLSIPALTPDYAYANVTCRATNNNITQPLRTSVFLELYTRPTSLVIKPPRELLVEGRQTRLECVADGAYPSALITWERILHGTSKSLLKAQSVRLGDRTWSRVSLVPEAGDHGSTITCRALNPHIPHHVITTSTVLQVSFSPRVKLQRGYSQQKAVTEGQDVFFECEVASYPPPHSITWRKDGVEVVQDQRAGVLVSGNNLVLQMVRRTSAGNYTCTATNAVAATTSNTLPLHIKYLPVCVEEHQTAVVGEGEDVRLTCRVDAEPEDNLRFTWFFNNTLDTVEVERHRIQVDKGLSYLDYTPRSSRDYGSLACWATNTVGTQADPCLFTVLEAGPPASVENCELVKHTVGVLEVRCSPGSDGGLPQWFLAKVYDASTHTLIHTLHEAQPSFQQVDGLSAGQDYIITITAVNSKGASIPQQIDAIPLKVAEKRMVEVSRPGVGPLVGVFLGLVGSFLFLLLLAVSITLVRSYRCGCLVNNDGGVTSEATLPSPTTRTSPPSPPTPTTRTTPTTPHEDAHTSPDVLISTTRVRAGQQHSPHLLHHWRHPEETTLPSGCQVDSAFTQL